MRKMYNMACDLDGKVAAAGKVDSKMMVELMDNPFFKRPVPRSGWKYDFSEEYCYKMLDKHKHLSNQDILATFSAFTAEAIVKNMNDYIPQKKLDQCDVMYASGGGAKNPTIMKFIQEKLPSNIRLASSDEIGIPREYKEACKFATLGYSTVHNIANNIPAACHASQYTIMGKVSFAPWRAKNVGPLA